MKLDYNILWFEDIKSSFEAKKLIVKEIVEEFGFNFSEPRNEIDGRNIEAIDYEKYDLLLVDLNLAGTKGPALIDKIRHNEGVYTEVIFYSSDGEKAVRNVLKEYEIDGAYCAGRENDDFEEKVQKVIKTTIKKVQDINNMRGLIMAETSDIDHTMLSIINTVISTNSFGIKDSLTQKIFENVQSKVSSKKDDFDRFLRNNRIENVIKDNIMFDTSQKILAIQFIIDSIDHEITHPHKGNQFSTSYSELKQKRDLLAHVVEVYEDGIKKLKSGNRELEFTDEFCVDVRVKIKGHSTNLGQILSLVVQTNS
ncbi:response regulator [Lacibacter luteus]|uniref:Response regulator n=1 Tax=Lacibacter luteus TaxID=2508719 RepID=A0A4Q1CJC7_9BACT|nr:response regulator [Lacibacter luteus]RXK60663.1 response regulator [Lacibacter luteus]